MTEPLGSDDKSIRSYILNDVIAKKPIEKSFKDLCGVIGKDAITFYDFQFWYYRFLNGDHDLDFDKSSEPQLLQFSDLSIDVIGIIVDKLDLFSQMMLRKASKPLRDFFDGRNIQCERVSVTCWGNHIHCRYDNQGITYTNNPWHLFKIRVFGHSTNLQTFRSDDYMSDAFDDLEWILNNPKLHLKNLKIQFRICKKCKLATEDPNQKLKFFNKFESILKPLNHQISVKTFIIRADSPSDILAILSYLKPGALENITISGDGSAVDWKSYENSRIMKQIIGLDQWKQAGYLGLRNALDFFPDRALSDFKKIHFSELKIESPVVLMRLRDIFAKSDYFERCFFDTKDGFNMDYLKKFIGVPGPPNEYTQHVRHYMIPNSDKYLEFQFGDENGVIHIDKKTRQV